MYFTFLSNCIVVPKFDSPEKGQFSKSVIRSTIIARTMMYSISLNVFRNISGATIEDLNALLRI